MINFQKFLKHHTLRMYDKEKKLFPHGHNGLYKDLETPLRNNAHYLCSLNYLYKTGWTEAKQYIEFILGYIESSDGKFNYKFRKKINKDESNGLIGIAWLIEGICSCLENGFINKPIIARLSKILSNFNIDESYGIWTNKLEPNGLKLGIDRTLNHQIWFTAMAARLNCHLNEFELDKKIKLFVSHFNRTRKLNSSGLYYHTLNYKLEYYRTYVKRLLKSDYRKEMRIKEAGYHSFNLLGIHLLNKYSESNLFDRYKKDSIALKITNDYNYLQATYNNPYGYPYNPIGFEHAVLQSFHLDLFSRKTVLNNINEQFKFWDSKEKKMVSVDSNTSNARLYEMTYINQEILNNIYYSESENKWYLNQNS